jgi:hypothetical protein
MRTNLSSPLNCPWVIWSALASGPLPLTDPLQAIKATRIRMIARLHAARAPRLTRRNMPQS